MKIFVAGANGRVGTELVRELLQRGHAVTAGVRTPEKFTLASSLDRSAALTVVKFDLASSVDAMAQQLRGFTAVYFTAGSRGKDLLQVDAYGSVKLQQATEAAGIKRFIQLSALYSTTPEAWEDPHLESLQNYQIAKFFADEWLIHNTTLDYTILQPVALVEAEPGTGSGLITTDVPGLVTNTIPNVATTLAEILELDSTRGKVIPMADGDTPIREALERA